MVKEIEKFHRRFLCNRIRLVAVAIGYSIYSLFVANKYEIKLFAIPIMNRRSKILMKKIRLASFTILLTLILSSFANHGIGQVTADGARLRTCC